MDLCDVHVRDNSMVKTYNTGSVHTWVWCTLVGVIHAVEASVSWSTYTAVVIRCIVTCSSIQARIWAAHVHVDVTVDTLKQVYAVVMIDCSVINIICARMVAPIYATLWDCDWCRTVDASDAGSSSEVQILKYVWIFQPWLLETE